MTAAADGRVQHIGWNPTGGGHTVLIDHGDLVTVYYHGAHKARVKVGQQVEAGTFLYTSGSTGASTGDHLHFETRRPGGKWGDTMDPERFLPKPGEVVEPPAPEPTPAAPEPPAPEPPAPFVPTGHPRPTADLMSWLIKRRGK